MINMQAFAGSSTPDKLLSIGLIRL